MPRRIVIALFCLLTPVIGTAHTIAIIGTGDVAGALGPAFADQGHTVVYGSRNPDRDSVRELVARTGERASATTQAAAASAADIVVLAVPGLLVDAITRGLGTLDGKIIVDPTNPLERVDGRFQHAAATSNTETIQAAAPGAHVVKAFSTINYRTMIDPSTASGPVTVPLAGNDDAAKQAVAGLVEAMGLEAIDVGDARDARWIEGMLILWINNRYSNTGRPPFEYHLRRLEQP